MNIITRLYRKTGWHAVFNYSDEFGAARSDLLFGGIFANTVAALAEGVFFTGFLLCYGIDIVNISILTAVPLVTSVFSLLTPRLLAPFKKRKVILSVSRILYYVIRIVGITVLPQVIQSDTGRIWGLIAITFLSSSINFAFSSGYSVWHMHYIVPEVRAPYYAATNIVCTAFSLVIPMLISPWVDSLAGEARLDALVFLRILAIAFALVDTFFYQRPNEPEYAESSDHHSLLDIFRIPLGNSRFMLTMAIYGLYALAINVANPLVNTWLLDEIKTGFSYTSVLAFMYIPLAALTQSFWSRLFQRKGTFRVLALSLMLYVPTRVMAAFVTHENYMWLMTIARIIEHSIWMGAVVSVNNLIYVNLPKEDQTCFLSFYTLLGNVISFAGRMLGTAVVALIGTGRIGIAGFQFGAVPAAHLLEGLLVTVTAAFTLLIRKKVDTERVV